jgi:hypothetical protein
LGAEGLHAVGREDDIAAITQAIRELGETPLSAAADPEMGDRVGRDLAHAAATRAAAMRAGDPEVKHGPRFDPTINVGHLLTVASILLTVGGGIWWTSAQLTRFQEQASRFQEQLLHMRRDIDSATTAALDRQRQYGPRIDGIERDNQVQGERIQNLSLAAADQRKVAADILTILGNIREDMATVRTRLNLGRRSELSQPTEAR